MFAPPVSSTVISSLASAIHIAEHTNLQLLTSTKLCKCCFPHPSLRTNPYTYVRRRESTLPDKSRYTANPSPGDMELRKIARPSFVGTNHLSASPAL